MWMPCLIHHMLTFLLVYIIKAIFLNSINWCVETNSLNVFYWGNTYFVHGIWSSYRRNMCLFLFYFNIRTLSYLCICCEPSPWYFFITFFVAYNPGHIFVWCYDVVLTRHNQTWFSVVFTHVSSGGLILTVTYLV